MAMESGPRRPICGTQIAHERLREMHPDLRLERARLKERIRQSVDSGEAQTVARELVTISTVVHVVYNTEEENVSDEQVASQIDALNRDFRARNENQSKVPAVWQGLVADAQIEFELASEDPEGNPTEGIIRVATQSESFGDDSVKTAEGGGSSPWPTDRYLNIWVCNLAGGLLGYAQFPGGPPETDGIVILYRAFGTTGAVQEPFNVGCTATHEVGHWLNLFHIWGDSDDCSGSDECPDTPSAQGPNYGVPEFPHVSCSNAPNGDMYMNYMDYTDDSAMSMFTTGQVLRMNATLATTRRRLAGLD